MSESGVDHLDIRRMIGLDRAHDGDIAGLQRFLRFFGSEMHTLAWSEYPDDLRSRILSIASECEWLQTFLDGYVAGQSTLARALSPVPDEA